MSQQWGGPPPGGGLGGVPMAGPGGEAPLGRIPFSSDDEKNIQQTALFMRISGALAVLGALFGLVGSVGVNLYTGAPPLGGVCFGTIMLSVEALMATLLFLAANAFASIVATDGNDQQHLAEGLRKLRVYFLVKAILWVLAFITCCLCASLFLFVGAAIFSAIGAAAGSQ